jgi:hypothetical protein
MQIPAVVAEKEGCDLVILREFLTLPFLFAVPGLFPNRRRLVLTLTHNLQQGREHPLHRGVLRALMRSGFRFCCLESDAGFVEVMSPRPGLVRPFVLPHVIPQHAGRPPLPHGRSSPRLGVVGVSRPEKNAEDLIGHLVALRDQGTLNAELLLGCPDTSGARHWADRVDHIVDTRDPVAYERALSRCDAIVFNYSEPHYWLRSSAVVTDAIVQGCAVVCPDYPVLRAQVMQPRPVGALFRSWEDVVPAIGRALSARREAPEAFQAYCLARSPRAVALRLDRFARERAARLSVADL